MDAHELREQREEIERELALLPKGSLVRKNVKGHEYLYHRTSQNGKRHEQYVPKDQVAALSVQFERRRQLEDQLRELKRQPVPFAPAGMDEELSAPAPNGRYQLAVRVGDRLRAYAQPVARYKRRECYGALEAYLTGEHDGRVFVLFGLRRTGKTTLIRQSIADMDSNRLATAAFVQVTTGDTLADLSSDLRRFEDAGITTVFIDEVTLLEDFIEDAALFSDVFAASGMKIVLSGTDSLGFAFASDDQLYDRCIIQHTTFIPYREFESVLGISGIDEYIRYGGTMSLGGRNYNTSIFASLERASEYVDTAIARNIQHALRGYQHGNHFRSLRDLYEAHELTSAVNRVVEDINHRFTVDVLTRDFKSSDLSISAGNLRRDRERPTDALDHIDRQAVEDRLRAVLEIRNIDEQSVVLDENHAAEIEEYLRMLDLIRKVPVISMPGGAQVAERIVISQPGLRYAQAKALVQSLLDDQVFSELSLAGRNRILERILTEIKGRMMEDIVLLETQAAYPDCQVFVLQFAVGEFDMVVFDPRAASCRIFEIKHSGRRDARQYRHLVNEEKRKQAEHRYGSITDTVVLYRGESTCDGPARYQNVEEYLQGLGRV